MTHERAIAGLRGFAGMNVDKRRAIAKKGGASVPREKRSFVQNPGLAAQAGRKGGLAVPARGRRVRVLCFMPEGRVPLGDVLLAQKVALELFEADALRVANRSTLWAASEDGLPIVRRYGRR